MTAPPDRYDADVNGFMCRSSSGDWVRYDDYTDAIAAAEVRGLRRAVEVARQIGDQGADAAADAITTLIPKSPWGGIDLTDMKAVMTELFRLNDLGRLDDGADLLAAAVAASQAALARSRASAARIKELQTVHPTLAFYQGQTEGIRDSERAFFAARMKSTAEISAAILALLIPDPPPDGGDT